MPASPSLSGLARDFALAQHEACGQTYDGKPYSYHLHQVATWAYNYIHLLHGHKEEMLAAAGVYVHDVIEDCRVTYNDVAQAVSKEAADISYLLATPKGKTRAERHSDAYYQAIATHHLATFVKIADRLANVAYSKEQGTSMYQKYRQEQAHFEQFLRPAWPQYEPMWERLERELGLPTRRDKGMEERAQMIAQFEEAFDKFEWVSPDQKIIATSLATSLWQQGLCLSSSPFAFTK